MIKKLLLLSGAVFFTSISFTSQAQEAEKYYETRICKGCNYDEAKIIAKRLARDIECANNSAEGNNQVCHLKHKQVVIFNASTREAHGFKLYYDGHIPLQQGMQGYLQDIVKLPKEAYTVLNEVVDTNSRIGDIAAQLTQEWNEKNPAPIENKSSIKAQEVSVTCQNSAEYRTIKQFFSGGQVSAVRRAAQSAFNNGNSSFPIKGKVSEKDLTIRLYASGYSGAWEYIAQSSLVINKHYNRNSVAGSAKNQVGYILSMPSNGIIRARVNDDATLIGGFPIAVLKSGTNLAVDLAPCVGEALDGYLPKVVAPLGTPPSGGNTGPSGGGVPNFEGTPITSGGGKTGGGYGSSTCSHHYYHRSNGAYLFSFEGPCP